MWLAAKAASIESGSVTVSGSSSGQIECIFKGQVALTKIFGKLLPRHILQDLGGVVYEAKRFETWEWVMEALVISLNQSP